MSIPIPSGVIPVRELSTREILSGDRVTSYRWEVLTHADGSDHLAGILDGVVEPSARLTWVLYKAVKGEGSVRVADLETAQSGYLRIRDLDLPTIRLRPVQVIEGLPENPLGVYLVSSAPEGWSDTGREYHLELHDKCTVLDQDAVPESYSVGTDTPILQAVAAVVASAGESINVDAEVTTTLSSPMVWEAGTTKLQIVNDLLSALNYTALWVDGVGNFQATPYVVPARRSLNYELLNGVARELVYGDESIYEPKWWRDLDMFNVPNRVIAVQSGSGDAPALVGEYTNTNPESPFSYPSRGRWITRPIMSVDTPDGDEAEVTAFLEAKAQASLIAASAVQAEVTVKHLPIPVRVSDVARFQHTPAGIDARHVFTRITLEADPLGLMTSSLQEVIDL